MASASPREATNGAKAIVSNAASGTNAIRRAQRKPASADQNPTEALADPRPWTSPAGRACRPSAMSGLGAGGLPGLLLGQPPGFGDEDVDDLVLGDPVSNDLAADDQLAVAVAARDPKVGLARLAGAVHDTAHDGDSDRRVQLGGLQRGVHFLRQLQHIDLSAAARRACHQVQ